MQEEEHEGAEGVDVHLVTELLYYSTFAIHFAYVATPLDLQRLLAQQGFALVAAEMNSGETPELPAYFLSASRKREEVILAVRGTASVNDFGTDVVGTPVPFPEGKAGMAHKGIVGAVTYLFAELRECLEEFSRRGYRVTLTGHSLGAACVSLLAKLLKETIPRVFAYGFGCPSCVSDNLCGTFDDCVINVVNNDDVVPRLNVPRSRALLQSLVDYKSAWTAMFSEDTLSGVNRAKNVWHPNYREESLDVIKPVGYLIEEKGESGGGGGGAGGWGGGEEEQRRDGVQWIQDALYCPIKDESFLHCPTASEPLEPPKVC